jgi:hypothetical protein
VNEVKLLFVSLNVVLAAIALSLDGDCQTRNVIVRPKEIHDILVNPGMALLLFSVSTAKPSTQACAGRKWGLKAR